MNRFTILLFFFDALVRGARRKSTLDGLLNGLKHDDPFVRRRAAAALSMLSYDVALAVPALIDALADADLRVRQEAALALKRMGLRAVPYLKEQLQLSSGSIRRKIVVLLALNLPGDPSLKRVLSGVLADRDNTVRKVAAWGLLSHRGPPEAPLKNLKRSPKSRKTSQRRRRAHPRGMRSKVSGSRRLKRTPVDSGGPGRLSLERPYARTMRAVLASPNSPMAFRVSTMSLAACPSR